MSFRILHATSHRNGVAGAPFRVAIVDDDECGRMLVIDFTDPDTGVSDAFAAVLNLDMAAQGNIYAHPQLTDDGTPIPDTGYNAWRGDVQGGEYRQAINDHVDRWHDTQHAAWRRHHEQEKEHADG